MEVAPRRLQGFQLTSTLRRGHQTKRNKLELVDPVGEAEDEGLEEG